MSCECNRITNQGKQYCQECMPDEFHWLVPVSKEPDPFLMDRNHAYIGPNNIIYVLSRDRVRAIKITTSEGNIDLSPYALKKELASKISELTTKLTQGLEGAKYFEGEGIRIDEDNRIHSTVTLTEVNQRLDSLEQVDTSPYKAGTGIEITPDLTINSTVDVSGLDSRVQDLEEQEDKDTTYTAGAGLQLSGTEFSVNPNDLPGADQLVDLNTRVTALENDTDADTKYTAGTNIQISDSNVISATDTKYTAGNGLILSGTEFSIDDSKVATLQELEETNTRLTNIEAKDIEQDGRLTVLEYRGTDYRTEIITTVASYYEEPYKAMGTYGTFDTTHHLRTDIGNYTIRDGIVFITIHRYVGETYDGQATVVGMFDEGRVSGSGLIQEHIVEMKTILSGNVKIHCELLNNETQQHFIIYNVPNDSNEKYEITVHGFNFVPKRVLVPDAPMVG